MKIELVSTYSKFVAPYEATYLPKSLDYYCLQTKKEEKCCYLFVDIKDCCCCLFVISKGVNQKTMKCYFSYLTMTSFRGYYLESEN